VIEKQINEKLVSADFEPILTADKCESRAQLQQKSGDVPHQGVFDVAFVGLVTKAEKIEQVWILQHLFGHLRVGCGQLLVEIGDRCRLPQVKSVLDVRIQG
jgi:hypothetical protein